MRVLGCKQKQMTVPVFEFVFVDAMHAGAFNYINKFKEVVLVGWFQTLVCFFIYYFKRLVKVLRVHTCTTEIDAVFAILQS